MDAPASFTARPTPNRTSRLSMAQGPAMMLTCEPPIRIPLTSRMVSASWNSREASLYGWLITITSSTPGSCSSCSRVCGVFSPIAPTIVRNSPLDGCGTRPSSVIRSATRATSSSLALAFITTMTSMVVYLAGSWRSQFLGCGTDILPVKTRAGSPCHTFSLRLLVHRHA